ncbi:hypothetical protein CHS0354_028381 [Potamilus streckersoni]|uniref:HTH OST-type domain-containing protein n=1 Tax=Potamilus streckersoni TaxID=2493646 RepID=A0AAE0RU32_9BIVA|nr:hypothetical protein CHS0354_028381 [Potamilus streckersoni]
MDEEVVNGSHNNEECSIPTENNTPQSGNTQSWQGHKPNKTSKASPQKRQNKKNGGSSLSSSKSTATSNAKTATGRIKSQEHNQSKEPQKNGTLPKQEGSQSAVAISNQSQKNALPHLPTSAENGDVGPDLHTTLIKLPNDQEQPLADIVKKVSKDKKPTRQILMLHQQMYQESQKPTDSDKTNNYSQFSNFNAASNQTGYYTMSQASYARTFSDQFRDNTLSGSYDTLNGYNSFQNHKVYSQKSSSYETSHLHRSSLNSVMIHGYERQSAAGNEMQMFQPAKSSLSFYSTPMLSYNRNDIMEIGTPVELFVSNLDYNISPGEWKNILQTTFSPHVKVVSVNVRLQPDNTSLGTVRVATIDDARLAISQFHRKKIGYKRIHVTLKSDDSQKTASSIRAEAVALLQEANGNVLPLFKFIELFDKRYHRSISVAELYKMRDLLEIKEQGGAGRMVFLLQESSTSFSHSDSPDVELFISCCDNNKTDSLYSLMLVQEILENAVCLIHCPENSAAYAEALNCSMLPNVFLHLKTFAAQVHSLMLSHNGDMPLMSFPACYTAEVCPLLECESGVPLEHLISCVPGIQIEVSSTGVKKVRWAENKLPTTIEFGRSSATPLLNQQLNQLSREMVDLLRHAPQCRMPVSRFIPTYHHHFGRQCRVADYGYNKLMELFEAIPHVLQILGTGDRKVLMLTHRAQVRRFTTDVLRLLKTINGRQINLSCLPEAISKMTGKPWDIIEYGVCTIEDMLADIPPSTIIATKDGSDAVLSIPKRALVSADQTAEEMERMKQFALEVVDLLKHNPQCRMPFNKFIPAYHHHFGRQCRVADYGVTKLLDLFEAIPWVVEVEEEEGEEKILHLTETELRKVVAEQIAAIIKHKNVNCLPLEDISLNFTLQYGYCLPLNDLHVKSVEELLSKLKHLLRIEIYDGKKYVSLTNRTSIPVLAHQVLQLLMDESGGSLPFVELCSRYKSAFGVDPDVQKIKEELLDYVQVSGDDESAIISLTPLQVLACDICHLLHTHGWISLAHFEALYQQNTGVELKPALYGFPNTLALLLALPHVVAIKGHGQRRTVHLSRDFSINLTHSKEHWHCRRPSSDTVSSSNSGSSMTDEDQLQAAPQRKLLQLELLSGGIQFSIPPSTEPKLGPHSSEDLVSFEISDAKETKWINIQEQRVNLTPTSELLQLAAMCLPQSLRTSPQPHQSQELETSSFSAEKLLELFKYGWWRASPSQLEEVSRSEGHVLKEAVQGGGRNNLNYGQNEKLKSGDNNMDIPSAAAKMVDILQSFSIANLGCTEGLLNIPDIVWNTVHSQCEEYTAGSVENGLPANEESGLDQDEKSAGSIDNNNLCYESVFQHNQPLHTSSTKSDTSDSLQSSPTKIHTIADQKKNASPVTSEASNSPRRRSRLAARFGQLNEA